MRSILEVNLTELENKTLYIHRIFKRFKLKQDENGDALRECMKVRGHMLSLLGHCTCLVNLG